MSLFLKAMSELSQIAQKADVIGEPRLTLTFDTEADKARFKKELERDINNVIAMKYDKIINASEFLVYGIKVRIL